MRTHENLPALNKYTSRVQYEALLEIDKSRSILGVVMNGASSRTLGALVRCMWIKQADYTDDNGIMREGWFVTDQGKHAMHIYSIKYEQEQAEARKRQERVNAFDNAVRMLYDEYAQVRPKLALLEEEIKQIKDELNKSMLNARQASIYLNPAARNLVVNEHALRTGIHAINI